MPLSNPVIPLNKSIHKTTTIPLQLYLIQFKPVSLYDHVHMVTGHPGNAGMAWHLKNTKGEKHSEEDASNSGVHAKVSIAIFLQNLGNALHSMLIPILHIPHVDTSIVIYTLI